MSGTLHAPLLAPQQASKLLDEVVFERVLGFIDLDGLFGFEQELWFALGDCGVPENEIGDLAKAILDRALHRISGDPRRYLEILREGQDCGVSERAAHDAEQKRGLS